MSNTYRYFKPCNDLHRYLRTGVIYGENESYFCFGEQSPRWEDRGKAIETYKQYTKREISEFHRGKNYRYGSIPRSYRSKDIQRQRRDHKHALRRALTRDELDNLVLVKADLEAGWRYW